MTWTVRRHPFAPMLVGVELDRPVAPAGEVGLEAGGASLRFTIPVHPEVEPALTAVWVADGNDTDEVLALAHPRMAALLGQADGTATAVPVDDLPLEVTPQGSLLDAARQAVDRAVGRLLDADGATPTWAREVLAEQPAPAGDDGDVDADGWTATPLWWGGLPDEVARVLHMTAAMRSRAEGDHLDVEVAIPPDLPQAEDLVVRAVTEDGRMLAARPVRDGQARLDRRRLIPGTRLELVDRLLRPLRPATEHHDGLDRQRALLGVAWTTAALRRSPRVGVAWTPADPTAVQGRALQATSRQEPRPGDGDDDGPGGPSGGGAGGGRYAAFRRLQDAGTGAGDPLSDTWRENVAAYFERHGRTDEAELLRGSRRPPPPSTT